MMGRSGDESLSLRLSELQPLVLVGTDHLSLAAGASRSSQVSSGLHFSSQTINLSLSLSSCVLTVSILEGGSEAAAAAQ